MEHLADPTHARLLKARQLNLVYVSSAPASSVAPVQRDAGARCFSRAMLEQLQTLKHHNRENLKELWLTHAADGHSQLYIFIRLDERDINSGWLGLEMDDREVSSALSDHSAGEFTMFNSQGMPLFSNSHEPPGNICRCCGNRTFSVLSVTAGCPNSWYCASS
jgi:two-component system capsular synthesis sensor histidine kinase RcsC